MRPTPAAPARSSRCFLRTASFPARSPESGETPSPVPPSRAGRLRFKKSDRAMSSPLCVRVLGVLGDKVGRRDLARGEPATGNRHGQSTGGGDHALGKLDFGRDLGFVDKTLASAVRQRPVEPGPGKGDKG